MLTYFWIMLGGALGTEARFLGGRILALMLLPFVRQIVMQLPEDAVCCAFTSAKATVGNTSRFTKRSFSRHANFISPVPRSCAVRWDSARPVASIPPRFFGSLWTLPIVIEIVDTDEKVQALLPFLDEMMGGGSRHPGEDQGHPLSRGKGKQLIE